MLKGPIWPGIVRVSRKTIDRFARNIDFKTFVRLKIWPKNTIFALLAKPLTFSFYSIRPIILFVLKLKALQKRSDGFFSWVAKIWPFLDFAPN